MTNALDIPPPAPQQPQPTRHPHALQPQWPLIMTAVYAQRRVDRLEAKMNEVQDWLADARRDLAKAKAELADAGTQLAKAQAALGKQESGQ